jgi:hypothetical protein
MGSCRIRCCSIRFLDLKGRGTKRLLLGPLVGGHKPFLRPMRSTGCRFGTWSQKGLKVCYEQRVMVTMYRTWPDLCSIHYSGRDGDWFAMGRNWLRNPGLIFSSNGAVLGNSANETLLPTTVVEEPVIFPAAGLIMAKTVHQLKV